jgi:hypothetical protein
MPETRSIAKIIFAPGMDQRGLDEAPDRGYLSHLLVEIDGSRLYPVFFYSPGGLQSDLETNSKLGKPWVAETGMIIVQELTLEAMQDAVQALCDQGYFEYMTPVTQERLNKPGSYGWPP